MNRKPKGAPKRKYVRKLKPSVLIAALPTVLQEADVLVNGPRQADYGDPRENFLRWRDMCRATGRPGLASVNAEDLAVAMICLKVCRDTQAAKRDNAVDGAAYFDLLERVRGI